MLIMLPLRELRIITRVGFSAVTPSAQAADVKTAKLYFSKLLFNQPVFLYSH